MNSIIIPFPDKKNFSFFMENNIDGFIVGIDKFSENFNHLVKKSELEKVCKMINDNNKKIYIMLNKVYYNSQMKELKNLLVKISKLNITSIIFSDMAVLNIVRENNINVKLTWYSKLTTNSSTMKFLEKRGVSGFVISPEITLDEQIEISKKVSSPCSIKLFGHNIMATSSRSLISNYFKYANIDKSPNKKYFMKDKSTNKYYPIVQRENTNFFSSEILNGMLEYKRLINENINAFVILDDYLISEANFYNVIEAFIALKNFPDDLEFAKKLKEVVDVNNYGNTYNGFLNKKTIYKVKNNE